MEGIRAGHGELNLGPLTLNAHPPHPYAAWLLGQVGGEGEKQEGKASAVTQKQFFPRLRKFLLALCAEAEERSFMQENRTRSRAGCFEKGKILTVLPRILELYHFGQMNRFP